MAPLRRAARCARGSAAVLALIAALGPGGAWAGAAATPAGDDVESRIALWRREALALEHGEGVPRDRARAAALYCEAARLGDAESQFNLGWMYALGRGIERDDAIAGFFFAAAAEQGLAQAQRMRDAVGVRAEHGPDCLRPPVPPIVASIQAPAPEPSAGLAEPALPERAPRPIVELVQKMAPGFRVEPGLVLAIMQAESNFDAAAVSPRNAQGLMQLIPDTAARFNVRNPFDPAQSIRGGMAYLRWLLAYFEGDVALVAAAYNAGERSVERYRGVPPYAETRAYVRRVLRSVGALVLPFDASVTPPSPQLRQIR